VPPNASLSVPPPRLVFVDDDEDAREIYCELLRLDGFDVVELESAEDALAYFAGSRADVVVTDVRLPGMSGCDAARALRADPKLVELRIVAVTGLYARDLGDDRRLFDAVLVKPVEPGHLVSAIRNLLRTR
jgi:CheY-like chemotaxis protein